MRPRSGDAVHSLDEAEFLGMDPAGDEQAVDSGRRGAGDVGAQAVADGEDPRAVGDAEQCQARVVDRTVGLAVPADIAALLLRTIRANAPAHSASFAPCMTTRSGLAHTIGRCRAKQRRSSGA